MAATKIKRTFGEQIIFTIAFILLAIFSLFIIYHLYFLLQIATKFDHPEYTEHLMNWQLATWSDKMTFSHFLEAFTALKIDGDDGYVYFPTFVWNSLWYSLGSELIILFFQSLLAYTLCKYKFFGRNFIYNLIIFRMTFPIYGSLPAALRFYWSESGWANTPWMLLTATDCLSSSALIMYAFFKGISWEYAEAAFIDGATHAQVYFRIMFPMAMPAISVLFITGFISRWNEYMAIMLYLDKYPTLAYAMYFLQSEMEYEADKPLYFSSVLLAAFPCLVMFLVFQNSIMQTVHLGGIKG